MTKKRYIIVSGGFDKNGKDIYIIRDEYFPNNLLTIKECCNLLNQYYKENEELKDDIYAELDKTLKQLQEIYEEISDFKTSNKLSRIYDNLHGLMEDVRK